MKPSKSLIRTLESMLEKQCEKHDAVFDMDHRDRFYLYFCSTDQVVVCGTEYESALQVAREYFSLMDSQAS